MAKRIECTVLGHEGEFIERVEIVTRKQWRKWRIADPDETEQMMFGKGGLIEAWTLKTKDGSDAPQPSIGIAAADELDMKVYQWLIIAISQSVRDELTSSPQPSGASST